MSEILKFDEKNIHLGEKVNGKVNFEFNGYAKKECTIVAKGVCGCTDVQIYQELETGLFGFKKKGHVLSDGTLVGKFKIKGSLSKRDKVDKTYSKNVMVSILEDDLVIETHTLKFSVFLKK